MSYVQPDMIPGTTTPIYGYGVVTVANTNVLDKNDGSGKVVSTLAQGTVVPVLEVAVVGEATWAHTVDGWLNLNALNMRTIYEQSMIPAAPEWPAPEPTEPTAPTEPSTAPTEPTTEPTTPTEPTTEPTAPTEPATEPPATEAPTAPPAPPATEAPTEPAATAPAE